MLYTYQGGVIWKLKCKLCKQPVEEGQLQMESLEYGRIHFKCWEGAD